MRNLLPVISVALSGCFYISAERERDRLALLDTEGVDTEVVDTDVGLAFDVLGVQPPRVFECQGAATLQVTSQVNDAFELTPFTVFAQFDSGAPVQLDPVTSGVGLAGSANLNFPIPLDTGTLGTLAGCGQASCTHDLSVAIVGPADEEAQSQAFPIEIVAKWTDLPDASVFLEDGFAARTDLASVDFLDAIVANPEGGVPADAYPTMVTVLSHPWFEVEDGPGDWTFSVLACPEDAVPVDETGCESVEPDVTFVDGKVEVAVSTESFAQHSCDALDAPWDNYFLKIEGDACLGTSVMPLESRDFRLVVDDCDGDGVLAATDCDDADPARAPDQVDKCDGVDGDCDGTVDTKLVLYPDEDGDGRGDATAATVSVCPWEIPGGVSNHDDCKDDNVAVYPTAAETCNGTDNNCTGDEKDAPDAVDGYLDVDQDGYGVAPAIHDCLAVHTAAQRATKLGDCNDALAAIHPTHAELCADLGTDNDCDLDASDASDMPSWYADVDKDGFGDPTVTLACLAPAGMIAVGLDCDDANDLVNPNGNELCDLGADEDCDGTAAVGCSIGDSCADDFDCTTGSCGTSGLCEPWTLWSSGALDESFSAVAVTSDGHRIWAFRSNSATLSVGATPVPNGVASDTDWVIVRTDETGDVATTSRVRTSALDAPTVVVAERVTGRYVVGGSVGVSASAATLDTKDLFAQTTGPAGHPAVIVFDGADKVDWAMETYDTGDGAVTGAAFAIDGDLFVGGVVSRTVPANADIIVTRLQEDPTNLGTGIPVWYRKYTSSGGDFLGGLASAPGGDVVISGGFGAGASVPATLDLGNGCLLTADDTAGDGFIARLDGVDGKCRWAVSLHQNGNFQNLDDVVVDRAGRVCFVGNSARLGAAGVGHPGTKLGGQNPITLANQLDARDVVVGCVDDKGVPVWWRALGGTGEDVGVGAAIDANGDLVIVGSMGAVSAGKANFGKGLVAADSALDVFAARYATRDGAIVDVGVWPAIEAVNAFTDVVLDPLTGDVLVAGYSNGPMDFGDTLAGDYPPGKSGAFLTSLGNGPFESTYLPRACDDLHAWYGALGTGVYPVDPDGPYGTPAFYARCDMTTFGGGWTRIATVLGSGGVCNMTNVLSSWTYVDLENAGPAVHGWLSAATVAPMFLNKEVRLVANVGPEWIFRASTPAWTWPNIANGTVNGGNVFENAVEASKDGTTFSPVLDYTGAFLLGGQVGNEYTAHLGGGKAGHANGLFDQTTQCPQSPYYGMFTDQFPAGVTMGSGGAVWVR